MSLWQNLLRFWPVTFADRLVTPAGALQAHAGTDICTNTIADGAATLDRQQTCPSMSATI